MTELQDSISVLEKLIAIAKDRAIRDEFVRRLANLDQQLASLTEIREQQ